MSQEVNGYFMFDSVVPVTDEQPARLGFDLARVDAVAESLARFGDSYLRRVYTADEIAYATDARGLESERLAARFAAKEALMKALSLSEHGIDWRDIEVVKHADGGCGIALHGRAAEAAKQLGVTRILLSMSHDGGYAGAVVLAWTEPLMEVPHEHIG
jgi:holo-[acyl-carrier protein] synthase